MTSTKNTTRPARLFTLLLTLMLIGSTAACTEEPVEYFTPPPSTPTPTPIVDDVPEVFERPDIRKIGVPRYPQAANELSEDGARTFAYYFLDVLNYTAATGDTEYLEQVSGPECEFCHSVRDAVTQIEESNRWHEGYNMEFKEEPSLAAESPGVFVFEIAIDSAAYATYSADGLSYSVDQEDLIGIIGIYRLGDFWLVEDMGQQAES